MLLANVSSFSNPESQKNLQLKLFFRYFSYVLDQLWLFHNITLCPHQPNLLVTTYPSKTGPLKMMLPLKMKKKSPWSMKMECTLSTICVWLKTNSRPTLVLKKNLDKPYLAKITDGPMVMFHSSLTVASLKASETKLDMLSSNWMLLWPIVFVSGNVCHKGKTNNFVINLDFSYFLITEKDQVLFLETTSE